MLKAYTRTVARLNSLRTDEAGNAAEYGLIVAGVAVVIISGLALLAAALNGLFGEVAGKL
ncbi:Flp family type IVb pilin [Agromyces sp. NPDC056379]|uniref:Flp family type IVb pilin n=1 Tax=unclassified Agromyces TaxID=2639701 RepID=UPI0035DCA755